MSSSSSYAPNNTVTEGSFKGGKLERLKIISRETQLRRHSDRSAIASIPQSATVE